MFADPALTLLLGAGMLGVQLLTAFYAFRLEREPLDVLWVFPAQQIVYRQLMYSVLIRSVASAVSGVAVRWQRTNRIGVLNNLLPKQSAEPARAAVNDHTAALALLSKNEIERRRESRSTSDTAPVAAVTGRERWLDLLKVAALSRVIALGAGAPAYLALFPAWGVLFGIGGSMMSRSAQHEPEVDVMGHRLRRVLVPLWVFGIVAVPLMLWQGWGVADDANPFFVANLVFWIFPFLDPPGSTAASDLIGGLWYIRACLWFVLLTPLMRAGMRRSAIVAMLVPLAVVGLDAWLSWGLAESSGTGPALMDFCTYATCWMFGMAHRDGSLKRVDKVLVGVLAVAALAGGALWTKLYVPSLEIDEVPLAAALLSAGVVIPLLSASPGMAWLDKIPVLRGLLGLITGRALTIYLLFPIAVAAVPLVVARLELGTDTRTLVLVTVGLTVLGVLLFGWVEDLAARRPLGVYPRYRRKKRKAKSFDTRAVPLGAPVLAAPEPIPVPQQAGPRQPVLQGAGGPPVEASGPHRAVGGWPGDPSIPQQVSPGRGQPERPPSWPPQAPPHRAGPGPQHPGPLLAPNGGSAHPGPPAPHHPGPPHPGLHHSGPQPGLPHSGPQPGLQHSGPQPGLHHSGPQPGLPHSAPPHGGSSPPPRVPHPGASPAPNGGPPHPGPQHSGEHPMYAGRPAGGPPRSGPPPQNGGPRSGVQHSGEHPQAGPPPFGPPPSGPRPPLPNGGPPPQQPHPDPHQPGRRPPPPQRPQPPPPAQRSGRPR